MKDLEYCITKLPAAVSHQRNVRISHKTIFSDKFVNSARLLKAAAFSWISHSFSPCFAFIQPLDYKKNLEASRHAQHVSLCVHEPF